MADRCDAVRRRLQQGLVIPAHPLALTAERKLDERRQRALTRYYIEAGSGGLAVGVHTTQFAIRQPEIAMYPSVLQLAMQTAREYAQHPLMIAGVLGDTEQALAEATLAQDSGYDAVLLSLGGLGHWSEDELVAHCRRIGEVLPVMGFYLQPAVGGIQLSYRFWRRFVEIETVIGIKIAPFSRYFTLDVVRAVVDAGRHGDIALYTGNDDTILHDLLTPFTFLNRNPQDGALEVRIVGGLLGHWAVWTRAASRILEQVQAVTQARAPIPTELMQLAYQITDSNAAFFDAANAYRGCIPGLHEVLRRQGLLEGIWCVDPEECLSPGQSEEIDRVYRQYPHLNDDDFVAQHRDRWLS
ncbi:MAG: dihydrodipicolinate synthase family protein [Chloroflexi bacterium]|nr:dihydrodipicolinate synthase family protein [Chloroflexota bacterium]